MGDAVELASSLSNRLSDDGDCQRGAKRGTMLPENSTNRNADMQMPIPANDPQNTVRRTVREYPLRKQNQIQAVSTATNEKTSVSRLRSAGSFSGSGGSAVRPR